MSHSTFFMVNDYYPCFNYLDAGILKDTKTIFDSENPRDTRYNNRYCQCLDYPALLLEVIALFQFFLVTIDINYRLKLMILFTP